MKFDVYDIENLSKMHIKLTEGVAQFKIIQAIEKISKTSNLPMLELTLDVIDQNNQRDVIYDYLSSSANTVKKIYQFCQSINEINLYNTGQITHDKIVNKTGYCILKIQYDISGIYDARIIVNRYITKNSLITNSVEIDRLSQTQNNLQNYKKTISTSLNPKIEIEEETIKNDSPNIDISNFNPINLPVSSTGKISHSYLENKEIEKESEFWNPFD